MFKYFFYGNYVRRIVNKYKFPAYNRIKYNISLLGILHRTDAYLSSVDQVVIETCIRLRESGAFNMAT